MYLVKFFLNLMKIGNKNNEIRENLCTNEPAINSSPNGPDNLLFTAS